MHSKDDAIRDGRSPAMLAKAPRAKEDVRLPEALAPRQISVSQLVERIGLGPAQLRVLSLAPLAVRFFIGVDFALITIISAPTAAHFGIATPVLLDTFMIFGVFVGSIASGFVGDTLGCRSPVLCCFGLVAFFGLLSAGTQSYASLTLSRSFVGFGMGLGLAPSLVGLSEITPERWRIAMAAASKVAAEVGAAGITILAALESPTLEHVNWRRLLLFAAVPPAVWWMLGWLLLEESPVFLACAGQRIEAQEGFEAMKLLNAAHSVSVDFAPPAHLEAATPREQLAVVFSPERRTTSAAVMFASLCLSMIHYGDLYAATRVFSHVGTLPCGWQLALKQCAAIVSSLVAAQIAYILPRRAAIVTAALIAVASCCAFAVGGAQPNPRSPIFEAIFEFGANCVSVATNLSFIAVAQFGVETYPPHVASTGTAMMLTAARLGGVVAPALFEALWAFTGRWYAFHLTSAALCVVAAVFVGCSPALEPYRVDGEEQAPSPARTLHANGAGYGSTLRGLRDGDA